MLAAAAAHALVLLVFVALWLGALLAAWLTGACAAGPGCDWVVLPAARAYSYFLYAYMVWAVSHASDARFAVVTAVVGAWYFKATDRGRRRHLRQMGPARAVGAAIRAAATTSFGTHAATALLPFPLFAGARRIAHTMRHVRSPLSLSLRRGAHCCVCVDVGTTW
jgi:hypothetical protein